MTTEEVLAELELQWPRHNKLSCPRHSDSDPSLHLYPEGKGFFCFSCNVGGDAWTLLSHYLDVPVADLMRDRGVAMGPRPRSRWQILDELEQRARRVTNDFTVRARNLGGLRYLPMYGDRVDFLYNDYQITARYFPEDRPPIEMERAVQELERFYEGALADVRALAEMREGL